MKLTPLADRVILKMVEVEETTKGGIILTASAKEKPSVAEVISVGPGGMVDGHDVVMTVKPGDKVKKNQVMLVYEAMKMENDLEAPRDLTVKQVLVQPDQVVGTDAILLEFE